MGICRKLIIALSVAFAVMLPSKGWAQTRFGPTELDKAVHALPTEGERTAANIASWATLGMNVAIDLRETIGKCSGQDECYRAITKAGLRYGITAAAALVTKHYVDRTRPCAYGLSEAGGYDTACGMENPDASFFSGHTAFAFAAIGNSKLQFSIPLAIGTGGLRVMAGKHWLTDTLVGAGVGLATGRIR